VISGVEKLCSWTATRNLSFLKVCGSVDRNTCTFLGRSCLIRLARGTRRTACLLKNSADRDQLCRAIPRFAYWVAALSTLAKGRRTPPLHRSRSRLRKSTSLFPAPASASDPIAASPTSPMPRDRSHASWLACRLSLTAHQFPFYMCSREIPHSNSLTPLLGRIRPRPYDRR
jgi:hypothetical protein